ncbi:cardiolipin synthase [Variovorax sp. HJSM1_2]|uniref:cardiolipin synthase n=1 Tax=Variovorax sp. HJSM1_2 TaxID=3366263 RepID=UPI003BD9B19B
MIIPSLSAEWLSLLSLLWSLQMLVLIVWVVLQQRAPVSTLSWILSLLLMPVFGFVVYYYFGPQRLEKQRMRRLRGQASSQAMQDMARLRDVEQEAPQELLQLVTLGAATSGIPVSSADDVLLLSGGDRTYDAIFEAIRAARHHVHLEYYIYEPDKIGTALRDLLVGKAQAGVQVRLLVDALGSKRVGKKFLAPLVAAGADVAFFHESRIGRRWRPVTNFRTHRKIVVCDGRVGFTGGVNITDEEDPRTRDDAYHDVHLRIEGCAVRWLQTVFLEDWFYSTGQNAEVLGQAVEQLLPPLKPGNIPVQIVTSGPDSEHEAIHRMHVAAINIATQRAWLTTPYFVPSESALMALTNAALRGVDVRLMVPRMSDSRLVTAAARSYYDKLIEAGVKIWEYEARMLHSKTLLVDEHCAMLGTANFDNRSFRLNFEVMAVVFGPALAKPLAAQFHEDSTHATEVQLHRRLPFWPRLGVASARLLSPLL